MTISSHAATESGASQHSRSALPVLDEAGSALSRRTFMCRSALSLVGIALAACGGSDATGPFDNSSHTPPDGSTTFVAGVLTISLASVPDLTATNGHVVIAMNDATGRRADVIVINVGSGTYRAFSSICTHEGCTVTGYSGTRMQCPCHGSEYDLTGKNVAGPAPSPLKEYTTTMNSNAGTLIITVS